MNSTVRDVAKHAEVSIATVSRVLNGNPNVKPELRDRVLAAIEELSFRPNRIARSFRRQTTNFLALMVPDIRNPFFAAVSLQIEEIAIQHGYTLLICNTNDDPEREAQYYDLLIQEAVAGIIVCTAHEAQGQTEVVKALDNGIVVVAIDRRLENVPIDLVLSDNFGGARRAVSYLLGLGHRRIGLITGPDRIAPARERRLGYEQAIRDHGLTVEMSLIKITDFRDTGAEIATKEFWSLPIPPTALFVSSGNSAIGTLRALNTLNLRFPDDLSLVVFDDLEWAEAYNPPITAVAQNTLQIGTTAVGLLLERLANPEKESEERRIPTGFHVRASCKPLAQ